MAKKDPYAPWKQIGKKVQAMASTPAGATPWETIGNKVAAAANVSTPGAVPAAADPNKPLATPAAPGWQDSTYNTALGNLRTNLANFGTSLTGAGTGIMADYGFTGPAFDPTTFDPNNPGTVSNDPTATATFHVDPNNPFSKASLLKKSYDQQSRGDTNSMAAAGQLYSGAEQNAQNNDTSNYNQGFDTLSKGFLHDYGNLYGQWLTAQGNEQTGEGTAASDAIGRWTNSGAPGPLPTPVQVAAAKQFGKPLSDAPYLGLGPQTHTAPTTHVLPGKPKPPKNAGALTVVRPKGPAKGGKK